MAKRSYYRPATTLRTPRARHGSIRSLYRRRLRLEPLEDRRLLALVTVTTPLDTINFNDGVTSLREAIFATNIVPGADEINFDFGNDDPATIVLTQGELRITDSLTISGPGANLLTIDASGSDPTPDLNNSDGSRIFSIDDGDIDPSTLIDVSISGLSLTGADAKTGPVFGNLFKGHGGAIAFNARLTLSAMNIFANHAERGGGIGGGGTLMVVNSTIADNFADLGGGGIAVAQGGATISATAIVGNRVTSSLNAHFGGGGGILATTGNLTVDSSTISGNQVDRIGPGGGILFNPTYSAGRNLEIRHSTISGNSVNEVGGGGVAANVRDGHILLDDNTIENNWAASGNRGGGGVMLGLQGGTATIRGNTIRENAAFEGGGIHVRATSGTLLIENSTIYENSALGSALSGAASGGGLYLRNYAAAVATIRGTTFHANTSAGNGAGIDAGSPIELVDCMLTENAAGGRGSAILTTSNLTLRGTIVSGNTTTATVRQGAGAIYASGDATLDQSTVRENVGHGVAARNVTLSHSTIAGNTGSGIAARGVVDIEHSDIRENEATGVSARDGDVTIHDTTIAGNGSAGISSGLFGLPKVTLTATHVENNAAGIIATGDVTLIRSSVIGNVNSLFFGAGIFARGNVTLDESTVSGNSALGIYTRGAGVYGGRSVTLNQSTVSGNSSSERGGGIASYGNIAIRHSTVANNAAGLIGGGIHSGNPQYSDLRIEIVSSIVAGNTATGGKPNVKPGASTLDVRFSLIGDKDGTTLVEAPIGMPDANGNLIGGAMHGPIDPLLAPLADNGGPTQTHALLPGSPAINRGDLNAEAGEGGVPIYDQRGELFGRVFGGRIDIGAFELQESSDLNLLVDTLVDESDGNYGRFDLSLREAIELANMFDGRDTIRFDPMLASSGPAAILLNHGELTITDVVTIDGLGANLLTIDAQQQSRIFNIATTTEACTITGLTLMGGSTTGGGGAIRSDFAGLLTIGESILTANVTSGRSGGALLASRGEVILNDTIVNSNRAENGAAGGGISRYGGNLTLNRTSVNGNSAARWGGGIAINNGSLALYDSVVSNNFAEGTLGSGGGIDAFGARLEVIRSTVSGNSATSDGGGIFFAYGTATITDSVITGNGTTTRGGGMYARGFANVSLTHSRITDNTAGGGTANDNSPLSGTGGGVFVSGNLSLNESTISGNVALEGSGGGVYTGIGTATFQQCFVTNNTASQGNGGGVSARILTAFQSTFAGNVAVLGSGGGISANQSTINDCNVADNAAGQDGGGIFGVVLGRGSRSYISNSTISGNTAGRDGGGIAARFVSVSGSTIFENSAGRNGGGVHAPYLRASNSTLHANSTFALGGGAWTSGTTFPLAHLTITGNTAGIAGGGVFVNSGTLRVNHTIVAMNVASTGRDLTGLLGVTIDAHYSLIWVNSGTGLTEAPVGSPDANGNLIGGTMHGPIDPRLGPLADNGGPTLTRALLPGSPAINRGNLNATAGENSVPLYDQRDEPFGRVFGGRIDIGAFEFLESSDLNLLVDTLADENDGDYNRGDLSLREAILLANQSPSSDSIRFDLATMTAGFPLTGFAPEPVILLTMGELHISDDLTIEGPAANLLVIDASGNDSTPDQNNGNGSRVFRVDDGNYQAFIKVQIHGLTLTGSDVATQGGAIWNSENLAVAECLITANAAQDFGGGIYSTVGNLHIQNTDIFRNESRWTSGGGIAVEGGDLSFVASSLGDNRANLDGGGLVMQVGKLTMLHSDIAGNNTTFRRGGGIALYDAETTLTHVEIVGNSSTRSGGGIYVSLGLLSVVASQIRGNESDSGGGIAADPSEIVVTQSVIENNHASSGGGIYLRDNHATIRDSSIANNVASQGGGIRIVNGELLIQSSTISGNSGVSGGAIELYFSSAIINNSTISSNKATAVGGAIVVTDSRIDISHSTITDNEGGRAGGIDMKRSAGTVPSVTLDHTIISGNVAQFGNAHDILREYGEGIVTARFSIVGFGYSSGLAETPIGSSDASGNLVGGLRHGSIDPLLGPLADNGGPTRTHALLPDSPAINAGDPAAVAGVAGVPTHDQRGVPFIRIFGGRIDIGAVESLPPGFLPGDYNHYGSVDSADDTVWQDTMGTVVNPGTAADGNGDGFVNGLDHEVWRVNFGATADDLPSVPPSASTPATPAVLQSRDPNFDPNAVPGAASSTIAPERAGLSRSRPAGTRAAKLFASDEGLIAWLAADRNFQRRAAKSIGADGCAAQSEEVTASAALDAMFDELGGSV